MSAQKKDQNNPTRNKPLKANRPPLKISIPSSSFLPGAIQPLSIVGVQESPLAVCFFNDMRNKDKSQAKSEIASRDRLFTVMLDSFRTDNGGDCTTKKARVPVVSFSGSCNSSPVQCTVPTSPPRTCCDWYDSDRSKESFLQSPDPFDDIIDSLLDSYLYRGDTNTAHYTVPKYWLLNEPNEGSLEYCDSSLSAQYGAAVDFLECLYDSYLDVDMTLEVSYTNRM